MGGRGVIRRMAAPRGPESSKGQAVPPSEPLLRRPAQKRGRRVGATLPTETFVAFKAFVARNGMTGEQAIAMAIERLVRDA